ncbi:MAG: SurA N-terminal domain-containing protein [Pseudomonadota bacterium]|nr:MAG: SurA N-terminal domain-containing protein [Pseudomonadota bacterium]
MLGKIREKTQGIIAFTILFLVGIPFILFGIQSYTDRGTQPVVATVGGESITPAAYRRSLDELRGRVDPKMLDSREFKEMIVESLIDQTLLARNADDQGYRVSDAQLDQRIRELPFFQRDGQYDPALFEAFLRREGRDAGDFRARLRSEIVIGQLERGVVESAFVTKSDAASLLRLVTQEREFAYAVVPTEGFAAKASVTEQAVEGHYNAYPERFMTEQQVRVEYLRLSAAELGKHYVPDEEAIQRAYADEAARYVTPERRRASHILIETPPGASPEDVKKAEARIRDLERQARAGTPFAQLVRQHSMDPESASKGGDLGDVRAGMLPRELESAINRLKLNELSEPVRTSYGFHLVKLTGLTPEKRRALKDVRAELEKIVRQRKAEEQYAEASTKLYDLVYESTDSLQPAAKAIGLEVQASEWFTRAGGKGMASNLKFVEAAFHPEVLAGTRNSDVIELDAGTLVALRVIEHRPAARRPLAEVRGQIERTLRQQQASEQARALSQTLLQELRAGTALKALAAKHNLKFNPPKTVTREQTANIDRRLVQAVFRAVRPADGQMIYDGVELGSQGVAVFALQRVQDGTPEKTDSATAQKVKRILAEQFGTGLYAGYRAGLRAQAEVKINRDQL